MGRKYGVDMEGVREEWVLCVCVFYHCGLPRRGLHKELIQRHNAVTLLIAVLVSAVTR